MHLFHWVQPHLLEAQLVLLHLEEGLNYFADIHCLMLVSLLGIFLLQSICDNNLLHFTGTSRL